MLTVGDIILKIDPTQLAYKNNDLTYAYYLLVNGAYSRIYDLIENGKMNYKMTFRKQNCLDIVAEFGHNLSVDYFLELGLKSTNSLDVEKTIKSDNISYVKEWIKTNKITKKLVSIAAEFGSINVLKSLMHLISDNDIKSDKHMLICAMDSGSIECFKIVFNRCLFLHMNDKIDNDGNTLAHYAAKTGNYEMIAILFKAGYSFTQKNNFGNSAYQTIYKTKKLADIFKSIDMENELIDIAVKNGDTKSIKHITNIDKILSAAIKYNQIYVIKWLQEKDILHNSHSTNNKLSKYTKYALEKKWDLINKYCDDITKEWSDSKFDSDWPSNIPINGQPILHILFSQPTPPSRYILRKLIDVDPEQKDSKGFPLIFKLLKGLEEIKDNDNFKQKLELLQYYFKDKFDSLLTQTDDFGCDIFVLLNKKKLKIVQKMAKSNDNLIQAVHTSQINKVTELLKTNANPYKTDPDQNTPLHLAIRNKDIPIALLLIKYMNRFDMYNNLGLTPFTLAATLGLVSITNALKDQSNIYAMCPMGMTALHYAAKQGNISSVKYLLSIGMPIDIASSKGLTPLYVAAYAGQLEMYNFLRKSGANMNVVDNDGNSMAIALIASNNDFLAEEVMTMPHFKDEDEQHKMLWEAAKSNNVFMLRILYLDAVKMDVRNKTNCNALDLACLYNARAAVKFLIECGLSLNIDRELIKDAIVLKYLDAQSLIQPLLLEPKKYNKCVLEKVKPTTVQNIVSYLTLEEKRLLGNHKLEFLASRVKTELGIRIFRKLLAIRSPNQNLSNIMHLLLDISNYQDIDIEIFKCKTYDELYNELNVLYTNIIKKTYPELPIDELRTKFLTKSEFVQNPVNENRLDKLIDMYMRIIEKGKMLIGLSSIELKTKLVGANMIDQIAIIRQAIFNSYKIYPYNTQMLAMLSFITENEMGITKKIGQIKTGEGKSTIITMIAAYYGCNKKYVDVTTTSHSLAIRDQIKYGKFYESLGLTSSHICDHDPKQECFRALIVYGTISDFEFSILRGHSFDSKARGNRPFDVIIIDEVDNISLDAANNSSRISDKAFKNYKWIYEPYYQFACDHEFHVDNVRKYLGNYGNVDGIDDDKLRELYSSAKRAKNAFVEDVHYIVKQNKIVIMDYDNTGTAMENCTWSFGIHQFLEVKHNVKISSEDITVASISHYSFIKQYDSIIGLTGTSGGTQEQKELSDLYDIEFFDVPPHFPNKRITLEPKLCLDNHMNTILEMTNEIVKKGRPVLIICKTIKDVMKFNEIFETSGLMYQLFTGKQTAIEEEIIDKAGQCSMVTIATNNAGRGTDIILSKEALKNGGLHVIVTCYMKNIRTEDQAKGRAGRQGQCGSCQVVLSLDDPFIGKLLNGINENVNLQILREMETAKCSVERMNMVKHNHKIYNVFLIFSARLKEFKKMIGLLEFGEMKKQCQNLNVTNNNYLINELKKLQMCGTDQAWETFIEKLKAYYLHKIMQQWSDFFVKAERMSDIDKSFDQFMDSLVLDDNFIEVAFI